jgi:hypothetical protein
LVGWLVVLVLLVGLVLLRLFIEGIHYMNNLARMGWPAVLETASIPHYHNKSKLHCIITSLINLGCMICISELPPYTQYTARYYSYYSSYFWYYLYYSLVFVVHLWPSTSLAICGPGMVRWPEWYCVNSLVVVRNRCMIDDFGTPI